MDELHNTGDAAVNLTGWRFTQGVDFTFPNITISGGGYLVIAASLSNFRTNFPTVTNVIGDWVGQLSAFDAA